MMMKKMTAVNQEEISSKGKEMTLKQGTKIQKMHETNAEGIDLLQI
jgi:hypothetical protein